MNNIMNYKLGYRYFNKQVLVISANTEQIIIQKDDFIQFMPNFSAKKD
jgi:hypothetical protein